MTFTEGNFWCLTAVTFFFWRLCRGNHRLTVALFLSASLVFYGFHHWRLVPLLLAYCVVDWAAACGMARGRRPRLYLTLGVTFNLALLAYWKYTPLLLRTLADGCRWLGLSTAMEAPQDWSIPFGISFYAFTGIAYLVDVYRRTTPYEPNFFRYALSAIFFPHLVAGPILRPDEFLTRLRPDTMPDRPEAPLEAVSLMARGLFKKLVLADRIALAVDPFFAHVADPTTAGVWSLPYVVLYAWQIYFDFSGYTDIARGLGLLFGYRWPDNFNAPYLAASVQEFWRRWHMTLSRFLRDYLYIPLGGNRRGHGRTYLNLMLTMLLGGLWHGASWSFVLWGGLHGVFLTINHWWGEHGPGKRLRNSTGIGQMIYRLTGVATTFLCVCLAWCFFRLTILTDALTCVAKWFVFDADKMLVGGAADASLWVLLGSYALAAALAGPWAGRLAAAVAASQLRSALVRGSAWGFNVGLVLLTLLLAPVGQRPPFIYFQF
ncbi:MAG: MBOAT family protein [Gemmataceae bacterium]|nr:MBOAT family protein [Gemmataceae bacterium]MDW8266063.1 MBOAT family O-acyltransferase [Gemmataceae bacterium]